MAAHHMLGASSAHRWIACPPSAVLCDALPNRESEYAREGSLAHKIVEIVLSERFQLEPYEAFDKAAKAIEACSADPLYQPEMLKHAFSFADYVKEIWLGFDDKPVVELEKRVSFGEALGGAFGTCDVVMYAMDSSSGHTTFHILDYKYGKGVAVSAEDNPQLKLYAYGVIHDVEPDLITLPHSYGEVHMHIFQPRVGRPSHEEQMVSEICSWVRRVASPAAKLALAGEGNFNPGEKQCRFCGASGICRAQAASLHKLATHPLYEGKQPLLDHEELGAVLKECQGVAAWVKKMEKYALDSILAGQDVPGFKAVAGRSSRSWGDCDAAFSALESAGVDKALLFETSPLSVAQAEKVIDKKTWAANALPHIITSTGSPSLAPESDKREALSVSSESLLDAVKAAIENM